ncbi:hypothetical protein DENSPDRAFT_836970 [Dentipellis sp. KUC8613]|nr:hypothetical protein DENSPDRAFT_836970 [Dentipellis sp. KUC8613]
MSEAFVTSFQKAHGYAKLLMQAKSAVVGAYAWPEDKGTGSNGIQLRWGDALVSQPSTRAILLMSKARQLGTIYWDVKHPPSEESFLKAVAKFLEN